MKNRYQGLFKPILRLTTQLWKSRQFGASGDRYIELNRTESSETDTHEYTHLILDQGVSKWRKDTFSTNAASTVGLS